MVKKEAIEKIRQSLTPEVWIQVVHEKDDKIMAEVVQEYKLTNGGDGKIISWRKSIRIVADKDGTIITHEGLF